MSATSTSSASSASNTSPVTGNGGILAASKSPPLILAFLAIGLFSAAMALVFGWRRVQLRRGWRLAMMPINHNINVELPVVNLEIPKLWDLSNGGNFAWGQRGAGPEVDWVNLMPLSARRVLRSHNAGGGRTESHSHQQALHSFLLNLNPLSRINKGSLRQDSGKKSIDEVEVTTQVAVIIALPSPQYPIHIKNQNTDTSDVGKKTDRQNMTDYCIGMYERSWQ